MESHSNHAAPGLTEFKRELAVAQCAKVSAKKKTREMGRNLSLAPAECRQGNGKDLTVAHPQLQTYTKSNKL